MTTQQWISVKEELPKIGEEVLVTRAHQSWDEDECDFWVEELMYTMLGFQTRFGDVFKDVIAWMPLPKPYRKTDNTHKVQKATDTVKAVIPVEVPKYQIGQEVSIYFKDTMYIKGICQETDTRN